MNTPTRILLVESSPVIRVGLKTIIEPEPDLEIVAEFSNGQEAVASHSQLKPDVTLYDLRMPEVCGVDAAAEIQKVSPATKIIILAAQAGDSEINRSLKNGACGYILKTAPPAEILKAIRAVAAGRRFVSPEIAEVLTENLGMEDLTSAELRVLERIAKGKSNKEIAEWLGLSENTIKTHLKNIFGKLGVDDRTAAVVTAIRRGIIRIDN